MSIISFSYFDFIFQDLTNLKWKVITIVITTEDHSSYRKMVNLKIIKHESQIKFDPLRKEILGYHYLYQYCQFIVLILLSSFIMFLLINIKEVIVKVINLSINCYCLIFRPGFEIISCFIIKFF